MEMLKRVKDLMSRVNYHKQYRSGYGLVRGLGISCLHIQILQNLPIYDNLRAKDPTKDLSLRDK